MILRIAVILLGLIFVLLGLIGILRPERLAEALMLTPVSAEGIAAIRALIGAVYLSMGLMTVAAVVRKQWAWLAPIAAAEGLMAVTRVYSAVVDGFDRGALTYFGLETLACTVLILGAVLPPRASR